MGDDPLFLGELDPNAIQASINARDKKTGKLPTELDMQKEARLAEKEKRLSKGEPSQKPTAAPKQAAPEGPAAAPPPIQDRSVLLDKISAYRDRFPHLKKRNNVSAKSTIEEIADELHYIEMQLGSQSGTSGIASTVLYGAMVGIETVTRDYWNPLGLDLNGLGTVAQQNMHEFQPLLDELMIKHSFGTYASPETRLVLMIGATVLTVNAANQNPEVARVVKSMNQAVSQPKGSSDL